MPFLGFGRGGCVLAGFWRGRQDGGARRCAAVGFAAEDVVGFVEDEFADFFFGERAVLFGLLGVGEGVGIGLFFEVSGGAGEAGEGVELADVVHGVAFELVG